MAKKTSELSIKIPEEQIKKLLDDRCKSLMKENSKLELRVKFLENKIKLDTKLVETCLKIYNEVKQIGDFYDSHDCYGDNCPCVWLCVY